MVRVLTKSNTYAQVLLGKIFITKTTSGLTVINLTAPNGGTLRTTSGNKESVSSPEDSSNLLLDTDLEVPQSLSSVELVEVSTLKLLMSVLI
jgi:hypothetical protein